MQSRTDEALLRHPRFWPGSRRKAQIEVFFLPAYAERNPVEYLNNDIVNKVGLPGNRGGLHARSGVYESLVVCQGMCSIFLHPEVKCVKN